ncbi:uncharacterized protein B0I36DRAFT_359043 [Microdochium trichocladiopsis]|uniref:Nudix hydrolase domain-containing protein n=1 Tax=Microdochium trichocladiopsis TaxID=1682393 RepID=A0A9P9BRY1_9PEZI|nr:uncharacterized protein B0I36DRAFT_359043 [Microdochium trichocladiopsis]KAH7037330.1 hypothetical protein B0I36DRAFT_359043 [Microdochium trichocladiopsis]
MARGVLIRPTETTGQHPMLAGLACKLQPFIVGPQIKGKFQHLIRREVWAKGDPKHVVDWSDGRTWAKIRREGFFHRSDEIMVSCGTVTIRDCASNRPTVLVVYNCDIGIFQLPKGRKDFDEGHLGAALRETTEETGIAVRPLRLKFASRATVPAKAMGTRDYGAEDSRAGWTEGLSNESIGVSEYPDPATGAWRNIHWFAAEPIGSMERDENLMPEEDDRRKFSTLWMEEHEAVARLKLDDERFMVQVAFAHLSSMSRMELERSRASLGTQ